MSDFLDIRELRSVFSQATSEAIVKSFENSGGASVTVIDNVTLAALVDAALSGPDSKLRNRIDEIEKRLEQMSGVPRSLVQRIETLEAQT